MPRGASTDTGLFADGFRDLTLPRGIFYWLGRAKKEAELNATIGSAMARARDFLDTDSTDVITCFLPAVHEIVKNLPSESIYPYAPIAGLPEFRRKWKKWVLQKAAARRPLHDELVSTPVVVPGVTVGLHFLCRLFLSPGETVLCSDLRWENYDLILEGILGLKVVSFNLFDGDRMDVAAFSTALKDAARRDGRVVVILNFPNNPSGYMPDGAESEKIRAAALETADAGAKVILIFDDAYDGYVYDPAVPRYSPFADFVNLHPNVFPFKLDGLSKEFLFYGGRVACVTAGLHDTGNPGERERTLEDKLAAFIRGTLSNSPHLVQSAAARALDVNDKVSEEREKIRRIIGDRWYSLSRLMRESSPRLAPAPFNSGFFCHVNVSGVRAFELADHMLKTHRVGVVASEIPQLGINAVRIAYCSVLAEDLPRLVESLKDSTDSLASGTF
ncbi:MAG: aminotransferase class I/II-fold pyridoxal phosphate-dependent enzyme [bacterium]